MTPAKKQQGTSRSLNNSRWKPGKKSRKVHVPLWSERPVLAAQCESPACVTSRSITHRSSMGGISALGCWERWNKTGADTIQRIFFLLLTHTCLHTCNHMVPDPVWSLGPKLTGTNTAYANFWTNIFIQKFYSTDIVQNHPQTHIPNTRQWPYKMQGTILKEKSHMKHSHFVGWQSCTSLWYSASVLALKSSENPHNSWIV